MPQTILYGMYVKNTLVLFMQNAGKACDDLHVFFAAAFTGGAEDHNRDPGGELFFFKDTSLPR